jgi:elongation factor Ts
MRPNIETDEETMAQVSASLVKELRERTGAGMMDCKKALEEAGADIESAVEWLRKKGLAAAAKKAGRVAEGLVAVRTDGGAGAAVEVNSETDFVARNDGFQAFVRAVAELALAAGGDLDAVKASAYPGTGRTVDEELTYQIATIGENMTLRRSAGLSVSPGLVASYVHNAVADGLGKIGVLVALRSTADADKLAELGKQLAMHVAATAPRAVTVDDLDAVTVDKERSILKEQALASGKPAEIVDKMVEGRLRKFYEEVVLLNQTYVIDGETKVSKVLEQAGKDLGAPVEIAGFVRFQLGEGVERKDDDFAAEVAQLAG